MLDPSGKIELRPGCPRVQPAPACLTKLDVGKAPRPDAANGMVFDDGALPVL
jgi:hypothetical protein